MRIEQLFDVRKCSKENTRRLMHRRLSDGTPRATTATAQAGSRAAQVTQILAMRPFVAVSMRGVGSMTSAFARLPTHLVRPPATMLKWIWNEPPGATVNGPRQRSVLPLTIGSELTEPVVEPATYEKLRGRKSRSQRIVRGGGRVRQRQRVAVRAAARGRRGIGGLDQGGLPPLTLQIWAMRPFVPVRVRGVGSQRHLVAVGCPERGGRAEVAESADVARTTLLLPALAAGAA
jgi:hypothetical protein